MTKAPSPLGRPPTHCAGTLTVATLAPTSMSHGSSGLCHPPRLWSCRLLERTYGQTHRIQRPSGARMLGALAAQDNLIQHLTAHGVTGN